MLTFTVSFPTPALPPTNEDTLRIHTHTHILMSENAPVTRMTFPVRSGMSLTLQVGLGGKDCSKTEYVAPMSSVVNKRSG